MHCPRSLVANMAVITLSNIKKSYGTRDLFEDVSFFVNERERTALIGANGTGKTTLLKIICDEESADSGNVNKEPGITIGYLPQEVDLPEGSEMLPAVVGVTPDIFECACVLADLDRKMKQVTDEQAHKLGSRYAEVSHRFDGLHGFDYQVQARAILLGLGFEELDFTKKVRTLSGGQKTRAALARLLLLSPDVLLLDEPTNHLDIQACEWLQDYLQDRYNGAALIVSHDRYFMDKVVSKVFDLDGGTVSTYKGNYKEYARQKEAKVEELRRLYKEQQKEITRIEAAIQTLFSDRKFSRRDSKIKQLERIKRVQTVRDQQTVKVRFASAVRSGREVLRFAKLTKGYPGRQLFTNIDYVAERGRKIGIVGPNGSGKTTLLKIIAERETADSGEVIFGHNVEPVYFAQEFDHLVPTRTVLEELLADSGISAVQARDLLAKFLFMGDDAFKRVEVLSGGEMCRLALAKVLAGRPNLLLLDEPTNHLDIASREALENALRSYDGTVIAASHDRYLLDAIADEIIEIKDGGFSTYLGNYSNYREKVRQSSAAVIESKPEPKKERVVSSLREMERRKRELAKKQAELESKIHTVEERMREITEALGSEETYRNGSARDLSVEYDSLSEQLSTLYTDWERVISEVAKYE
ncbi:MAG: ABC-F family ATP-binding cassette domain-containing protein [Armatimonadota bacterium]